MKIRGISFIDRFIYLIMCLVSLGVVYLLRIIVTEGIAQALKEDK